MRILLDKFVLSSDGTQYTVSIIKKREENHPEGKWEKDEPYQEVVGYYGKFEHALEGLVENKLKHSNALIVEELKVELVTIKNFLSQIMEMKNV